MKVFVLFISLVLVCGNNFAQINLVKNPSFEDHRICPGTGAFASDAYYWSGIVDTDYYSDSAYAYTGGGVMGSITKWDANSIPYFLNLCDTCSSTTEGLCYYAAIPHGMFWNHYPKTGKGMMWSAVSGTYDHIQAGMYLQGRLYHALQSGKTYCVTFYVVNSNYSGVGCNHIAAYFDDATIDTSTECGRKKADVTPQIISESIITDTINWTQIQGSFIATGTERFITIGNFDSTTTSTLLSNSAGNPLEATYLIDDVSVIAIDDTAYAGPDRIAGIGGDSVWVGDSTGYLPCYWYSNAGGTWQLIDSNKAGFLALPDTNTSYAMQLDVCGHITTDTMTVWVFPLGVRSPRSVERHLKLYPNPAHDELIIEGAQGCTATLLDLLGRAVKTVANITTKQALELSDLPAGVYNLCVSDPVTGERVVRRVVKE